MTVLDQDTLFSRSIASGYRPLSLQSLPLLILGCGALGSDAVCHAAVSGVRHLRCTDPQAVGLENYLRLMTVLPSQLANGQELKKAKMAALSFLRHSHDAEATAGYATTRFEALGTAPLVASGAVLCCLDSLPGRAKSADLARLIGRPFIVGGIAGPSGYFSVWPNDDPEAPCWRCLHPSISATPAVSCADFARAQAKQGFVPSIHTTSAIISGLMVEAAILALQGEFPFANKTFFLNVRTGDSEVVEVRRDPRCPGLHRTVRDIASLPFGADATAAELVDAAERLLPGSRVRLSSPVLTETPCVNCGAPVRPMRAAYTQEDPAACKSCRPKPSSRGVHTLLHWLDGSFAHRSMPLRRLGFAPGTLVEMEDGDGRHAYATLQGGADELFSIKKARGCNGRAESRHAEGDGPGCAEPSSQPDPLSTVEK